MCDTKPCPYDFDHYFPKDGKEQQAVDPCCSVNFPEYLPHEHMPGEFGPLCIRKTFLCVRCGRSTLISLKRQDAVMAVTSWQKEFCGDAYIDNMARNKGWLFGPAELRGETFCYMLCPSCIQADIVRFYRLERFFQNEK